MTIVHSKALNHSIQIDRIIGQIDGEEPGPILIFFGGIHGNEPSGVFALQQVIDNVKEAKQPIRGTIYTIAGNLKALARGQRYIDSDLNRLWTDDRVTMALQPKASSNPDYSEQEELVSILTLLRRIATAHSGPFYFFDLHSTSSNTIPFITINDTLLNRKFALHYPVPVILGIEEHLNGPILSFINQLGYIAIGFESGQHDSMSAIENDLAFIYHSLVITGSLEPSETISFCEFVPIKIKEQGQVFEIVHRHRINNGEQFHMNPGFVNFQNIKRGEPLAFSNNELLVANTKGKIFMPLYQNMGDDGYFIIKRIPYFFLKLSSAFRKIRIDELLTWLPGISWDNASRKTLRVNLLIARFLAKDFLHLLGYRVKQSTGQYLSATKREHHSSNLLYQEEVWTTRHCNKR
ncbi:MAG TPA: succinylglutamate desuccinylase/aspartoacylase family protein [Cyclobacteriaceae bacterium]